MDDFSIFCSSFTMCLANISIVLKRCEKVNLVLSWKKSHFMVQEGIVLGHKVSKKGIEVDEAKADLMSNILVPSSMKQVRFFFGHAGLYQIFIKNLSKMVRPLPISLLKILLLCLISLM